MPDHPDAEKALAWIRALYDIDERTESDPEARAAARRSDAPTILAEMRPWLEGHASITSISIGNAAAYTLANWERLTRFVEDVRVPLDNNATERGIRGPVVGRRNHFGSK